ncbi:MAG: phosphate ABC transporter permease subunit PstC [Chromatiales bacterium]|jgi:phosphate transport system permease protein|nr:phosphate ABC transporter permease subunit PstC [Chromatiales bacterium]
MSNSALILLLLGLTVIVYQLGLARSRAFAKGSVRMNSRPQHHGAVAALWAIGPALMLMMLWSWFAPAFIDSSMSAQIHASHPELSEQEIQVAMRRIDGFLNHKGLILDAADWEPAVADALSHMRETSAWLLTGLTTALISLGLFIGFYRMNPSLRARSQVEKFVQLLLMLSSGIAILTTLGIVLSMVGETLKFFSFIRPVDFFFGTTWQPVFHVTETSGYGEYGMPPLMGGTLLVAAIALLFAIPVGLMAAVWLAEYAPERARHFIKPALEVLAGIPTIVYGVFALITVGPFLSALGEMLGLHVRSTCALTAGLVMGIMLIPFISSLSDDIITQVPKSLRDGSLGLGATQSETIRRVVLPAALPGIAGAVLLAASRAVGEAMIVVLAAGNAPKLTANPFDAVSTMTVTIVNQITGDSDFSGPQSLVAFALGLTLFVITLVLNFVALLIVRRYREQYD